jgi:outer membrane protein OmpA-like peptidoglycan-associated protein/tetratricopeptide (TPR) repeat protein
MKFRCPKQDLIRMLFLSILVSFTLNQKAISQNEESQFDELINEGNFENAIEIGNQLLEKQQENPNLNFKIGYCYMNIPLKKNQAIQFLEKADDIFKKSNSQTPTAFETRFYLGQAYHKTYNFDKAIDVFNQMKTEIKNKEMQDAIDEEIAQCYTGKLLVQQPVKMQVTNIGISINSAFADHSPVLSADESVLIFTSRRKRFEKEVENPDGQYNEDIYISDFNENKWSQPKSISKNINSEAHEASIGISADGQQLLIYSEADGGTISISTLMGDEWSAPVNLGANINTRYRETHASMSAEGNYIYFTSDRPGGYGGMDIYVSTKQPNGSWGKAVNLGPGINTEKDEEGPFIHHDGVTLYFSSKGHETMGGYDIFMSQKNDFGTWTKPENLGYPVNTTEDDVFFVMTADGKRAYFASYREGGLGGLDIYMMGLPEAKEKPVTIVKGEIAACKAEIGNVQIKVFESGRDSIIGLYKPNSKTGKYLFILTRGKKYEAVYEIAGKENHRERFEIAQDEDFQIIYKHIDLKGIEPCNEYVGRNEEEQVIASDNIGTEEDNGFTTIENIMFKVNTADIGHFSENIQKLAKYLKNNSGVKVEIVGFADTQGPEIYNFNLSQKRAQTIYNYLIKEGVNKKQLSYKGVGIKNQITINNYQDGSYVWQSLPYNRRVEFKVIDDPTEKLQIKTFKIPKIYDINKQETLTNDDFKEYEKIFTIQVGAFSKPIGVDYFKNLKNIQMYYSGKLYHYTVGEFESVEKASEELKRIYDLGYKDAFIRTLAFYFPKNLDKQISEK